MWLAIPGHAYARGKEQPQGRGVAVAFHRDTDVSVLDRQECPKLHPGGIFRSSPESHGRKWTREYHAWFSPFKNDDTVDTHLTLGSEMTQ